MAQVPSLTPQVAHSTASAAAVNTSLEALRTGINNIDSTQLDPDSVTASEIAAGAVGTGELAIQPACRVHRAASSNQLVAAGSTAIQFTVEQFDTATMHDTVTNNTRITMPIAGVYLVTGSVQFSNAGINDADYAVYIRLNGTTFLAGIADEQVNQTSGFTPTMSVATTYSFAASDYVELVAAVSNNCAVIGGSTPYSPVFTATFQTRAS